MPSPSLSLWPSIGLAAKQHHRLTAWRAWELARHYDKAGSGVVEHADLLRFYTLNLNLSLTTGRKFIKCAVNAGYFQPITRKSGVKIYKLLGAVGVANSLGLTRVDNFKVTVQIDKLIGKGWQSELWAAFTANQEGRPRSRETLEKITHIPRVSQRAHERKANIEATPAYIHDEREKPEQYLHYLKFDHPDYPKPHAFLRYDMALARNIIVYRAPDIRKAPARFTRNRGRSKSVNQQLNALLYSLERERSIKLYHASDKGIKATSRRLVKQQIPDTGKESIQALYLTKAGGKDCLQFVYQDVTTAPPYYP